MPVYHTIKSDIFTLVIEGEFSAAPFFDALERGMADRDFKAPMRALIDARKATSEATAEMLGEGDRFYAEIGHCFIPHWAVVAASDQVLFGIARRICLLSDLRGVDMRPYADIGEARCRLTWNNFFQEEPFCRVQSTSCRPNFIRPSASA
jgi:hypothetical protein